MDRQWAAFSAQGAGDLEAEKRTNAMSEKNKWFVRVRRDLASQLLDEGSAVAEWLLMNSMAATRQLKRTDFHLTREPSRPIPIGGRACTCIGKAKHTEGAEGIGVVVSEDGRLHTET